MEIADKNTAITVFDVSIENTSKLQLGDLVYELLLTKEIHSMGWKLDFSW